jgi:hypothetical protein
MIPRFVIAAALLSASAFADPVADMAAFSSLKNVDLAKLAAGEVMSARGPAMHFARGLAIESCYVVKAPVAKTVELQRQWSPARHPELKVWLHSEIAGKPSPESFAKISSAPANGAVKNLATATEKLNTEKPELYMSAAEAKQFAKVAGAGSLSGPAGNLWAGLLAARAQSFASGGLGSQPPYAWKGESLSAKEELGQALKELPKVHTQFSGILDAAQAGSGRTAHYWELFDAEGTAAFTLGATFEKNAGGGTQVADLQYYASGGYFVFLTLYQLWPVKIGDHDATLVWRADILTSPSLGELHGMERMGSSAVMMKQIKQVTHAFLKDTPQ